jgi:membrane associated rhomboid family serine protease/Flp pilus assembly protein TadD
MANCIRCGRQLPGFSFKKICQWCVQHEAAQRGEDGEEPKQRVMPTPWVRREASISLTQILFGANVAVFLGMALAAKSVMNFPGEELANWGANYGPWTLGGQWWRLFTYMFLHMDFFHIAFNMWCLWDLGALCESLYGRWTFLCLYLLTGVAAGFASVGWNPGVLSVGASGAIFGLAGALIASFGLGEFSLPREALSSTFRSLLFFVGFNVLFGFGFNLFGGALGYVDNAAHVGGLASGLIMGALIAKLAPDHDNSPRRIGVLLISLLMVVLGARQVLHWRGQMFSEANAGASSRSVDRMIDASEKKVQQNPDDASAHYALAHAFLVKRQFAQGEKELKRVLELQPENAQARMLLASVYLEQEQSQDAREQFTKLIAQDPDNAKAHAGLGATLSNLHDHAAAIAEYQAALKLDPEYGDAYYNLGVSYANLKQYDDAIAAFLNARAKSGDDPGLEEALATVYEAKGMTAQATAAKNRAAQLRGEKD